MNTAGNELIDINDALARVGGNMSLYKRLLGRFLEGDSIGDIENAIQSGNMEEAVRHAHSLKGVSANLSLVKVRAASIELEQLLKNNADHTACLTELKQVYNATIEKISEFME